MATARSDLVAHFRLDAEVHDDYTIISESVRGKRNVKHQKKWVRQSRRPFASGGFGSVWLEYEEGNKSNVRAVKVMRKPTTRRAFHQDFEEELWALAALSKFHHNVAEFFGWWEDDYEVSLVLEYFPHRDLHNCIKGPLPEREARDITSQILEALKIIHGMGITHRDLKPQNILVAERAPDWWVKIGDFGISKRAGQQSGMVTKVGTVAYMAPEVLDDDTSEQYTSAVDLWAMGCMTYSFLTFDDLFTNPKMVMNYAKKESILNDKWQKLSQELIGRDCIDFIKRLVSIDAERRPSAVEALQLPWMQEADNSTSFRSGQDSEAHFRLKSPSLTVTSKPIGGNTTVSSWQGVSVTEKNDRKTEPVVKHRIETTEQKLTGRTLVAAVQDCAERCQCVICLGCASHQATRDQRGPRTEYVIYSCGNGHFSGKPICQNCLLPGELGLYKCPICREETDESRTRQGHQSVAMSKTPSEPVAATTNSVKTQQSSDPPPVPKKPVSMTTSAPPALPSRTSVKADPPVVSSSAAPEIPKVPTPTPSSDPANLLPTINMLDNLTQLLNSLSLTMECRGCSLSPTIESWVCLGCKEAGDMPLTCTRCSPRSEATHRVIGSTTLARKCFRCYGSRCYLISQSQWEALASPSASTASLFPPSVSSFCSLACKCDQCGVCVIRDSSHFKCNSCLRPRCGPCSGVAGQLGPIPWCSSSSCASEMMFPAANGKFKPLPRSIIPAYFDSLASLYARPSCSRLGCACGKCGQCSQTKYTYRCKPCMARGSSYLYGSSLAPEHTCRDCMYQKLMVFAERPICITCGGSQFQAYEPLLAAPGAGCEQQ